MNWEIYAVFGIFGVGIFNTLLEATRNYIPKSFEYKHMFLCIILIIAGIISSVILFYYYITKNKEFNNLLCDSSNFKLYMAAIPAVILCVYLITNTLALHGGGGIAIGVINLNMYVTLFLGYFFLKDKLNLKIIVSAVIAAFGIGYAAYESNRIHQQK